MAQVDLIGDEIHMNGFLVAMLVAAGTPATVLAEFTDGLNAGTLFETDEDAEPKCPECDVKPVHALTCSLHEHRPPEETGSEYCAALADVLSNARAFVKGGLIRFADLEKVVAQLKEEGELDK